MSMTVMISTRTTRTLRDKFKKKASKFGKPSVVHRDILQAFVDDRMTITPDPKKPRLEK